MATMTTRDLGALIQSVGTAALEAQKKAVFNAALHMKNTIEGELHRDLKGKDYFSQMLEKKTRSGKFTGIRPQTHRLTVGFNVKGVNNPTALLVARGPWGLLEYGSPPHEMTAKVGQYEYAKGRGARKRAQAQRRLDIAFGATGVFAGARPMGSRKRGFGPRYRVANHPGTKGKKTFSTGVEKATPKSTEIATSLIQTRVIRELRTQFGSTIYIKDQPGSFRPVVG